MFGNTGFLAFHPFSTMRDELSLMGLGPGDLPLNHWMEMRQPRSTWTLVDDFSPCSRPRAQCCPHVCVAERSQVPRRQHFVILPNLLTDTSRGGHEGGDQKSRKGAAGSDQCQRKDAACSGYPVSPSTDKDAGECSSNVRASENDPWQFSVDMKGCDEVRATTEGGMLVVEGRGSSNTSQQMVRYVTSLPRHVTHDSLTASLSDGRLTVKQKGEVQLEGQARTLPIDVQRHGSHEPEEQRQQERQSEAAEDA